MNNRSLALVFDNGLKGRIPAAPIALINVETSTGWGGGPSMCISAKCSTYDELDTHINRLIGELEHIRAEAKNKFATA
jgi:hypothetical protein